MLKLPTQFDARARHSVESSAAGGSTTTTCSCCIVTLGAASVATSMYFHGLKPVAAPAGEATEVAKVVDVVEATEPGAPSTTATPPAEASSLGRSLMGLVLPLMCLAMLALSLVDMSTGSVVVFGALALGLWGLVWEAMHRGAGRKKGAGLLAAVIALALMAAIGAAEVSMWF